MVERLPDATGPRLCTPEAKSDRERSFTWTSEPPLLASNSLEVLSELLMACCSVVVVPSSAGASGFSWDCVRVMGMVTCVGCSELEAEWRSSRFSSYRETLKIGYKSIDEKTATPTYWCHAVFCFCLSVHHSSSLQSDRVG